MRIFIALLFDEENKNIIHDILQEVKVISKSGNFTERNNLHLTLVYIGKTCDSELKNIRKKLSEIKIQKFNYMTNKIKYFKKSNNQKIVYLGVDKTDEMLNLYNQVVDKLNELDYHFLHEKLTPHITLGRKVILREYENVRSIYCNPLNLKAIKISIMESKRVEDKLVYEELYKVPLI